jgi:hypothetical protein
MAINLPGAIKAGSGSGNMWDENSGPVIGRYIKKRSDVGPNSSMVYTLQPDHGEEVGVWGSTVIDSKFKEIPVGSMVGIEYIGKVSAKRGGSSYKDYDIEYVLPDGGQQPVEAPTERGYADQPEGNDVVIKDLDKNSNIDLDSIPF